MQIGIDIGGSHIGVGVVSEQGKITTKKEINLYENFKEEVNKEEKIRDMVISLIRDILKQIGAPKCVIQKIGIACPGTIKEGIAKDIYNLNIKSLSLKKELEEEFYTQVEIHNDAKCAGVAEKLYGSLQNYEDCVFLCLGTGIGGATFIGNQLLTPKTDAGSEYGHMIIQKDGTPCQCGNKGCFEKYASMSAFKKGFIRYFNIGENHQGVSSEAILQYLLENKNEIEIQNYIEQYIDNLILGIYNITRIIEPQAICLGGSFVYFHKILYTKLLEKLEEHKYKFHVPEIVLARLGNDAGIIGSLYIE